MTWNSGTNLCAMKTKRLAAILLVLLYVGTAANALACSCRPPYDYFWDFVSRNSKNAMVRLEKSVQPKQTDGYVYGKFVVLENYNTPDFKVNDTITLNSMANTCGFYLPGMRAGDTLLVALDSRYELYAACGNNYIGVRNGYAGDMSLQEVKARIMTITNAPEDLVARNNVTVYPNPATTALTVKFPYAGKHPYRIEVLDMSGRVVKTKETAGAEEYLDIQSLPKGLYMLRLSYFGTGPVMRKWVKA